MLRLDEWLIALIIGLALLAFLYYGVVLISKAIDKLKGGDDA